MGKKTRTPRIEARVVETKKVIWKSGENRFFLLDSHLIYSVSIFLHRFFFYSVLQTYFFWTSVFFGLEGDMLASVLSSTNISIKGKGQFVRWPAAKFWPGTSMKLISCPNLDL